MAAEVKVKHVPLVEYICPYPKKTKDELENYRYWCVDGECFTIAPSGATVYAGTNEKILQKLQDEEKQVVTPTRNRHESDLSSVENLVANSSEGNSTTPEKIRVNLQHKKGRGRPEKNPGKPHRTTLWRRNKKEEQGILFST